MSVVNYKHSVQLHMYAKHKQQHNKAAIQLMMLSRTFSQCDAYKDLTLDRDGGEWG